MKSRHDCLHSSFFQSLSGSLIQLGLTAGLALGWLGCSAGPNQSPNQTLSVHTGATSASIIGGTPVAAPNEIAHMTALVYDTRQFGKCTATILNDEWLITAAHCVDNADIGFLDVIFTTDLGELESRLQDVSTVRDLENSPLKAVIRSVDRFVENETFIASNRQLDLLIDDARAHGRDLSTEQYDAIRDRGDVALLHIHGKIPESYHPAVMLAPDHVFRTADRILFAGYGVDIVTDPTSAGVLRAVESSVADPSWANSEILFDQRDGKGSCHGDSGGPAFVRDADGSLQFFGVISRGARDDADSCNQFSVATDLHHYRAWLHSVTGYDPFVSRARN